MKGLNKPIYKSSYKNNKKQSKPTARNLLKLCSQVFPNSLPVTPILRGGPSLVGEEKKKKKEKHQDGSSGGKKKKERQKEAPVKEERKKRGYFVHASVLTPNTLVPC